jgi:hypothetical protein
VLVLERVRELVRERDLDERRRAGRVLDDREPLRARVVEAGDLVAEQRPRDRAQARAGLEQAEQLEQLLVGPLPRGRVLAVELREPLRAGLRRGDLPDRRLAQEAQPPDQRDPALDAIDAQLCRRPRRRRRLRLVVSRRLRQEAGGDEDRQQGDDDPDGRAVQSAVPFAMARSSSPTE